MKAYNKLILKVLKIDPMAAAYLAGDEIKKLNSFEKCRDLHDVMFWTDTPQGIRYWCNIQDKLEELK